MVVVDTDVLGYLLLEGEQTPYACALLAQEGDWRSESFVMVEMTNVLANAMRARGMPLRDATNVPPENWIRSPFAREPRHNPRGRDGHVCRG